MIKKLLSFLLLCYGGIIYGQLACPQLTSPTNGSMNVPVSTIIEWNDVMGARLAKAIADNPEEIYTEKAAAYVENKERVKPKPRPMDEYSPIRMSYRPSYTYAFAKKLKESISSEDLALLIKALNSEDLDERVEFEKFFNIGLTAFNRSISDSGWGTSSVKAPEALHGRKPNIELTEWLEDEESGNKRLALRDESGTIVSITMSKAGSVKELSFS